MLVLAVATLALTQASDLASLRPKSSLIFMLAATALVAQRLRDIVGLHANQARSSKKLGSRYCNNTLLLQQCTNEALVVREGEVMF